MTASRVCAHDGSHIQEREVSALGYDYVVTVVAPTVGAGRYTLHECSRCGDSYQTDETGPLPAPRKSLAGADVGGLNAKAYTGASLAPEPAVALGGATLAKGADDVVTFKNAKGVAVKAGDVRAAGAYRVVIEGKGGYEGSVARTFAISKASALKLLADKIADKTYFGSTLKSAPSVKFGEATLKADSDYMLSYKNNKNADAAIVTVKGIGDFTGTKAVKFKIVKPKATKVRAAAVRL